MTCTICQEFYRGKRTAGGFGRDAWLKGCTRLKCEVVQEHEGSKMHRDANAARRTQEGVQRMGPGGMFAKQFAQRDDAVVVAMKLLFWLIKENIALEKWNSLKLLLESLSADEISFPSLTHNASYSSCTARDNMLSAFYSVVHKTTVRAFGSNI